MNGAERKPWSWFLLETYLHPVGCALINGHFSLYLSSIKRIKTHLCDCELGPPRLHTTSVLRLQWVQWGATPSVSPPRSLPTLSTPPPALLFPRWQGPRAPLFSFLVGGRRALCLAAIVPDTRFYLMDTRAVKGERERRRRRRRGHRWPLFRRWWRWKDETRWPSVVRVCNL